MPQSRRIPPVLDAGCQQGDGAETGEDELQVSRFRYRGAGRCADLTDLLHHL